MVERFLHTNISRIQAGSILLWAKIRRAKEDNCILTRLRESCPRMSVLSMSLLVGILFILTFCLAVYYTLGLNKAYSISNLSMLEIIKTRPRQQGSTSTILLQTENKIGQDEVRHIAFLKVHKAASTTIQNIIYRFGMKKNLTFVLAQDTAWNYVSLSVHHMMPLHPPPPGGHYDILCNHAVFNEKSFKSLLPSDTIYIAIVREPLERFISAANYYRNRSRLAYLRRIPKSDHMWLDLLRNTPLRFDKKLYSYTRNSMAKDFGFELINTESKELVSDYLAHLGQIFDFVLIKEYFDESVVVMKRILRWSFKDVIYLPRNVQGTDKQQYVTKTDRDIFRKTNFLDIMIYDFFLQKFLATVKILDEDFKTEVGAFKQILSQVSQFCLDPGSEAALVIPSCVWSSSFTVTRQDCEYMKTEGTKFLKIIQTKQGMFDKATVVCEPGMKCP